MTASTKFSLEGKVLKLNTFDDAAQVVSDLNAIAAESLEEIVFSGNTFNVGAAKAVADALKNKVNLKIANLSDIFTGRLKDEIPLALDAFVDAFVDKKSLQVIDLSDNAFGPAGAAPIRRLFIENRSITTLKLNNNGLGIEGGRLISTSLIEAAAANEEKKLPNMHTIIMGRNRLESVSARNMSLAFPILPNLKELRMPQNGIRPDGIEVLLAALGKSCPLLEILDVQDNTFTKPGAKALAIALPSWPNLRILNVGDCLLGRAGSKTFLKALTPATVTPNLETLIYTFNEMDIEGAKLIPGVLATKKKLGVLHLNGNTFDAEDDVVEVIRGALRANGFVEGLDELEDMEEVDSEAEEEEDDEDEDDVVAQKPEADVDALANALGGVHV
ncbi:RNI-like protein [Rhizoclosmatium globosum]|uniref:RNI-like protein n=1 Tax=Rhizoclosmatium globosum TaxID=329046 RepID=A0A1Y2C3L4_9FUNG|nr:RNI-like protein [Rhizoclosmatium globosum]|eukprot:ORY41618.1 RNI-like protein [Rhizoclosmatium globosum]